MTREHLWPDWLRRELAIKTGFDHRFKREEDGAGTHDLEWSAPPFNQRVKAVCAQCNSGWMSSSESDLALDILEWQEPEAGDRRYL